MYASRPPAPDQHPPFTLEGGGHTLADACEALAIELFAVAGDQEPAEALEPLAFSCVGASRPELVAEFLFAIEAEMRLRRFLFAECKVHIDGRVLEAIAWGERVDAERHRSAARVHGLVEGSVEIYDRPEGGLEIRCDFVFDENAAPSLAPRSGYPRSGTMRTADAIDLRPPRVA